MVLLRGLRITDLRRNADGKSDHWWGFVEAIRLDGCHLRRLRGLERLTSLRQVSVADNELTSFEGLQKLTTLQELQYEVNTSE